MVLHTVFYHDEVLRYRTHLFSKATLFIAFCALVTIIAPLLIAYQSYGFWVYQAEYIEMPYVQFKHQYVILATTEKGNSYVSSSYRNMNAAMTSSVRNSIVSGDNKDFDYDGKDDCMTFSAEMPLEDSDKVTSINLILVYDYKLNRHSTFVMESLGYVSAASVVPGSEIDIVGDLQFVQYSGLSYKGTDNRYRKPVVEASTLNATAFSLDAILRSYTARNITTRIANQYVVWKPNRPAGQPFKVNVRVNYRPALVMYTPGFFYVMKWAWVQYVSLLIVFIFVFERVKQFVFSNQLVQTMVQRPQLECLAHGYNLKSMH